MAQCLNVLWDCLNINLPLKLKSKFANSLVATGHIVSVDFPSLLPPQMWFTVLAINNRFYDTSARQWYWYK